MLFLTPILVKSIYDFKKLHINYFHWQQQFRICLFQQPYRRFDHLMRSAWVVSEQLLTASNYDHAAAAAVEPVA